MVIQVEYAQKMIEQAERELADANERAHELKVLIAFLRRNVQAHAAATSYLPMPDPPSEPPDYRDMSFPKAVQDVLRRQGGPLHVKRIAAALVSGGRENAPHLTVSITSAARRRTDLFVQTAKATFGLRNGVEGSGK